MKIDKSAAAEAAGVVAGITVAAIGFAVLLKYLPVVALLIVYGALVYFTYKFVEQRRRIEAEHAAVEQRISALKQQ